jgi:hypothetical protein
MSLYLLAAGLLTTAVYSFSVRSFFFAFCWAAEVVVVVVHLFLVNHLMRYLRRFHPTTWVDLGRPSFPTIAEHSANPWPFVQSGFLTMQFIFGTGYKSLQDERLNRLIWLVRILLVCAAVGMIVLGNSQPK